MAKAELKTKKTAVSPESFLMTIKDEQKRKDSFVILEMMKKASESHPKMWGPSIIGFGDVVLKYESGRVLDWFKMGFSPRKEALTLYGLLSGKAAPAKLGKFKSGKGCLYIKKLEDIDVKVLKQLMVKACGK
jgi:hypothetical protein